MSKTNDERAFILLGGVAALVAEIASRDRKKEPKPPERPDDEPEEVRKARDEGWEEGYAYLDFHQSKRILEKLQKLLEDSL